MRCIEIDFEAQVYDKQAEFNNNMRCIEIIIAIKFLKVFKRLITT